MGCAGVSAVAPRQGRCRHSAHRADRWRRFLLADRCLRRGPSFDTSRPRMTWSCTGSRFTRVRPRASYTTASRRPAVNGAAPALRGRTDSRAIHARRGGGTGGRPRPRHRGATAGRPGTRGPTGPRPDQLAENRRRANRPRRPPRDCRGAGQAFAQLRSANNGTTHGSWARPTAATPCPRCARSQTCQAHRRSRSRRTRASSISRPAGSVAGKLRLDDLFQGVRRHRPAVSA